MTYVVLFEGLLANLPVGARRLTVAYYFRTLVLRWVDLPAVVLRQWETYWQLNPAQAPGPPACVQTLLLAGLVLVALSALWFATREFPLKTPGSN